MRDVLSSYISFHYGSRRVDLLRITVLIMEFAWYLSDKRSGAVACKKKKQQPQKYFACLLGLTLKNLEEKF